MGDMDPAFHFDAVDSDEDRVPWDLEGVLSGANSTPAFGTSLDHKIQQRLTAKGYKKSKTAHSEDSVQDESEIETTDGDEEADENTVISPRSGGSQFAQFFSEANDGESEPDEAPSDDSDPGDVALAGDGTPQTEQDDPEDAAELVERRQSGKQAGPLFDKVPESTSFKAASFAELNLGRPLLKACAQLGYTEPTPIQAACIPLALMGRDISGSAVTGSGKTAAYGLPLLDRLLFRNRKVSATYVLILTPTRELAVQVHSMMEKLAQFTDVRVALVVGGLSLQTQAASLRTQPEVVVATPGRLIDHLRNTQSVELDDLQALVLDEADRLLEMGFAEEVKELLRLTPRKRQTMLFSATMTEEVKHLAALSLRQPVRLAADPVSSAPSKLTQEVVRIKERNKGNKEAVLLALCARNFERGRTIVFFQTKKAAHRAKMLFGLCKLSAAGELHGDMTQAMRLDSLERFRKGEVAFLLATDVAARGLDILGVETVINYDAPSTAASYLHRVGRTARAGQKGRSITFVEDDDRKVIKQVLKQQRIRLQERVVPSHSVRTWAAKIEELAPDIDQLVLEEREERQLRKAEMEFAKAENMIAHEAEIYSRPARTWFQTPQEKRFTASREGADAAPKGAAPKRNREEGKRAVKQAKAEEREREGPDKKKQKLMQETGRETRNIRAIKAKESELREQGLAPAQARKLAAKAAASKAGGGKVKKRSKDAGLFEDGASAAAQAGPSKVYSGGRRSAKVRAPSGLSDREKKQIQRGGKGARAFKSKAKFKRR